MGRKNGRAITADLPEAMICAHPICNRLAVFDGYGQTGLCPEHVKGAHSILINRGRKATQHATTI